METDITFKLLYMNGERGAMKVARHVRRGAYVPSRNGRPMPTLPFRKLGFACVGLTNEVDDYVKKAGPREIWNVSPNKIILKMNDKDLQKALSGSPEHGHPPLIDNAYLGKLIASLKKEDGAYSQGLWWSDEAKGTFVFMPTGFDYWCAASKPIEVATVHSVKEKVGSYFKAVSNLAEFYSNGVLDGEGRERILTEEELFQISRRC